jgi:hypothetical protein
MTSPALVQILQQDRTALMTALIEKDMAIDDMKGQNSLFSSVMTVLLFFLLFLI